MDPPPVPTEGIENQVSATRSESFSQKSDDSHTAADYIHEQLQMEADAREALPYSIDTCTRPLGALRQILFACITCNPEPANPSDPYTPAGVCYACSVQCHGDHELVELFNKRNFTCDCGTTRLPATSPCTLRINPETNTKGGAHSETPEDANKYNQNFRNRFCGCGNLYDPYMQKGTMFQCLGLGTTEDGGCGEDWWHPGCIVGMGPDWFEEISRKNTPGKPKADVFLTSIAEVSEAAVNDAPGEARNLSNALNSTTEEPIGADMDDEDEDPPIPPGFPHEDDFDGFLCYKCVEANPWIKKYADTEGFLGPVFFRSAAPSPEQNVEQKSQDLDGRETQSRKRKAENETEESLKRVKTDEAELEAKAISTSLTGSLNKLEHSQVLEPATKEPELDLNDKAISTDTTGALDKHAFETPPCKAKLFKPAPTGQFSLFLKADFRDHFCRCHDCFPVLTKHPQLLEEEENYEPPLSEASEDEGGSTVGSGSIYERGESALKNVDRVKAIEGVMAYNHLKDKLKPFFQQFAESGQAISADDIKAHFAKMRGDEQAIKDAGQAAKDDREDSDKRREQGGY
ncbi:Protein mlo2 [Phlyctema vagabunda]|uniref:Protein mlo2 n=1 Tax=Phlyctema vagabunda TaxID=108571 RepID=A0ABR4PHJ1_9HELO